MKALAVALLALATGCSTGAPNVTKGPGSVFDHARVHLVSWNGAPTVDNAAAVLPDLFAHLAEYGVGALASIDSEADSVPLSGTILDLDAISAVNAEIAAGTLPAPTSEDVYAVFLPAGSTTSYMELLHFAGYHLGSSYQGTPYALAFVTGNGHGYDVVGTHELVESATDPYGLAWRDWSNANEVCDICEDNAPDTLDGVSVTQVWSQAAGACE